MKLPGAHGDGRISRNQLHMAQAIDTMSVLFQGPHPSDNALLLCTTVRYAVPGAI